MNAHITYTEKSKRLPQRHSLSISFIIPTLNQGSFINDALDSILAQNLAPEDFEVWVIDGGSCDATIQIVKSHPLQPRLISESDRGQWDAVNKGILESRGDVICWLNSDDRYVPGSIKQALKYLSSHPDCLILYGDADYIDEHGERIGKYAVENWSYSRLIDICYICQPATIFKREITNQFGLLSGQFPVAIDLDYWIRIGRNCNFQYIPVKIAESRIWHGTKSSQQQLQMQWDALRIGYYYTGIWSARRRLGVSSNIARYIVPFNKSANPPKWIGLTRTISFHIIERFTYIILTLGCWIRTLLPR